MNEGQKIEINSFYLCVCAFLSQLNIFINSAFHLYFNDMRQEFVRGGLNITIMEMEADDLVRIKVCPANWEDKDDYIFLRLRKSGSEWLCFDGNISLALESGDRLSFGFKGAENLQILTLGEVSANNTFSKEVLTAGKKGWRKRVSEHPIFRWR